ncbi:MAG: nucleoside triphosphate pyrophosphatase [Phycisphaerae bacterium]
MTSTTNLRLILASASPRRRELLATLVPVFDLAASPYAEPENKPAAVGPRSWAEALAYFKARAVAEAHPRRLVLGADTIVVCGDRLLNKARDADEARRMLRWQAGRRTEVVTGVALVCLEDDGPHVRRRLHSAVTSVWMRADDREIERYVQSGDWQGKAGAYGIQDAGDRLVERIDGEFSNVVGLPVPLVRDMLTRIGGGWSRAAIF